MQIIDKNKDYYDYCQFEFGPVDKTVTYVRQGHIITEDYFYNYCYMDFVLLEVGYIQYILESNNMKWIDSFTVRGDVSIFRKFDENIHLCPEPMTIIHFKNRNCKKSKITDIKSIDDIDLDINEYNYGLRNPILKNTPIPSMIPARELYNALDNYLRSMNNDKNIEIVNSDLDKIINRGFDKKTSFRHPIK
jgi:hypothetical protein